MTDEAPDSDPLATPPSRWFVVRGGQAVGPLSLGSLLRELAGREAPRDVLVWTPGLESWRPAAEVPLVAAALGGETDPPPAGGGPPPPVPPGASGDVKDEPAPGTRAADWIAGHLWQTALAGVLLAAAAGWIGLAWLGAPGGGRGAAGGEVGWLPEGLPPDAEAALRRHASTLADSVRALAPADARRDAFLARSLDGAHQTRLAFDGLRRLPDSAVVDYATSWSRILERVEEPVCGRLSRWSAISPTVWRAVAGLEPAELEGFLETVRRAVLAELTGGPPTRPPPVAEMRATYEALLGLYDPVVSESLADLLTRPEHTRSEACRTDRLLYGAVAELGPPHSARLARAIVSPRR